MASADTYPIWPSVVFGIIVVLLVMAMLVISHLLGERHNSPGRNAPYESGVQPTGSARLRYDVRYYLVGVIFILFDVEAAIILAWAVAFRELGWAGYASATLFIITLAIGLVYIWKLGGLDYWHPHPEQISGGEDQ